MSKVTTPEAACLYETAAQWLDECLSGDGSLFTPGAAIWSPAHLDELEQHFVQEPDLTPKRSFLEKLRGQLKTCSPAAVQLMAELHVVHFLMISPTAISGAKKRSDVATILGWMPPDPPPVPDKIAAALSTGIAHPGQWALTRRDTQLVFLIRFARAWKDLDHAAQFEKAKEPFSFRALVESIDAPSADQARLAVLHLCHPETFDPIVSPAHKRAIVKRFGELAKPSDDLDVSLQEIREAVTGEYGAGFSWYAEPLVHRWLKDERAWPAFTRWVERFRSLPDFDEQERNYKFRAVQPLTEARGHLDEDPEFWIPLLEQGFKNTDNNMTSWRTHQRMLEWVSQEPVAARGALDELWTAEAPQATSRLRNFFAKIPEAVLPTRGERLNIGSFLLMAVDPEHLPVFKISVFDKAWQLAGWGTVRNPTDDASLYERALVFLDELLRSSAGWAHPLRDRLDAQGAVWAVTRWTERPPTWPPELWEEFLQFRQAGAMPDGPGPGTDPPPTVSPLEEPARLRLRYECLLAVFNADETQADAVKRASDVQEQAAPVIEDMLRELDETRDLGRFRNRMSSESALPQQLRAGSHNVFVANLKNLAGDDGPQAAAVLSGAYRVPGDEDEAAQQITALSQYAAALPGASKTLVGMAPLAASVFWALQAPGDWPPLWSSAWDPAAALAWLAPPADGADRYLAYRRLLRLLDDDPVRAARVLRWYGRGGFAGVDPTAQDRCGENAALARSFYDNGRAYRDAAEEDRAATNIRRLLGDLRLIAGALAPQVSEAIDRPVAVALPPARYGVGLPYRHDAFVAWRPKGHDGAPTIRVWITVDGVTVGLYPGWQGAGWYSRAAERLGGRVPPGYQFFRVRSSEGSYVLEPVGSDASGGEFLLGRQVSTDVAVTAELGTIVVEAAALLRPALTALLEAEQVQTTVAGTPTAPEGTGDIDRIEAAAQELFVPPTFLQMIVRLLADKGQVVFYGPPGTGKTYLAQRLARAITGDEERVGLVQFHPATSYEDFFEGLRPELTPGGQVTYTRQAGPLVRMADAARAEPDRTHVMIIDEINRANLPKVFGELLFLLEYRKESAYTLYRPTERFRLPPNLWFIGTMNTADRSIALIDAAMRRRFHFVGFFPNRSPIDAVLEQWLKDRKGPVGVADLLQGVNQELATSIGDHLLIGPSHFMRTDLSPEALEQIWEFNIFPYLEEQFWGDSAAKERWSWAAVRQRFGAALTGKPASATVDGADGPTPSAGSDEPLLELADDGDVGDGDPG